MKSQDGRFVRFNIKGQTHVTCVSNRYKTLCGLDASAVPYRRDYAHLSCKKCRQAIRGGALDRDRIATEGAVLCADTNTPEFTA